VSNSYSARQSSSAKNSSCQRSQDLPPTVPNRIAIFHQWTGDERILRAHFWISGLSDTFTPFPSFVPVPSMLNIVRLVFLVYKIRSTYLFGSEQEFVKPLHGYMAIQATRGELCIYTEHFR
jgi:hypothetical protein